MVMSKAEMEDVWNSREIGFIKNIISKRLKRWNVGVSVYKITTQGNDVITSKIDEAAIDLWSSGNPTYERNMGYWELRQKIRETLDRYEARYPGEKIKVLYTEARVKV